jgi:glycosyltransferase involved in cell wall biosynthesis
VLEHFQITPQSLAPDLQPLDQPGATKHWLQTLARESPDILWLHFFPTVGLFPWQLRRRCPQARICFTDHVSRGRVRRGLLKNLYCRLRARLSHPGVDVYLAVSDFVAKRLCRSDHIPASKVVTVANAIPLDRFQPGDPFQGRHLTAICHMRPQKGVPILLEALALLRQHGQQPQCRLVGDGPELPAYRQRAQALGLDNVHFLGLRDDVPAILAEAMLAVVPSVWPEAFGLAAAEAMAASLPVIASRVGGLPEVVEDGVTGLLVPPGDPQALARALATLLADPQLRLTMGRAGRARAERLFDLRSWTDKVCRILLNHPL